MNASSSARACECWSGSRPIDDTALLSVRWIRIDAIECLRYLAVAFDDQVREVLLALTSTSSSNVNVAFDRWGEPTTVTTASRVASAFISVSKRLVFCETAAMRAAMRAALVILALGGFAACDDSVIGRGVALSHARDLIIVAHQDDDLLFMQPDLVEAVRLGGVTSVYVTAGNGTKGVEASEARYDGLMAAYSAAAGSTEWQCGWISISGHNAEHCRLEYAQVSLVFLAYPDGGMEGQAPTSLLHLWEGHAHDVRTVALKQATYTQDGLLETVAEIIRTTNPTTIRTLEVSATHGRDHSDHMIVGALTLLAMARAPSRAEVISYRGYNVADEPANSRRAIYGASTSMMSHYQSCVSDNCEPCGLACSTLDPPYVTWLHRRYAVGFRRSVTGRLRLGNSCADIDSAGTPMLGNCETARSWSLDASGELRIGEASGVDRCLEILPTGDLAVGGCIGGATQTFFYDDEGRLWAGVLPLPHDHMDYAHLSCLVAIDRRLRIDLCGAGQAPAWELVPSVRSTARTSLGLTATGRAVRLGDLTGDGKADLCAVESRGLMCAAGDGAGGFAPAIRIDTSARPLAIDPRSLVIGDVDGDGALDACGRDADGILCARASSRFAAERWTVSFGDREALRGTSASLAAIDANADGAADICGLATPGVICARHGLTPAPSVRSGWPDRGANVWLADLDGDRQTDWCAATNTGPACGVEAQRDLTTEGSPWGFARGGVVESIPAIASLSAFADIDGDGRADLCSLDHGRVSCARSQGRAFGPHTTLAVIDGTALWLGDLNGDGTADACADTGPQITCALSR